MKIVLNKCWGGFSLSDKACEILDCDHYDYYDEEERTDSKLIAVIEELGSEKASGGLAKLTIVNVPDEATDWKIYNYDGIENVIYVMNGKLNEE